MQGVHSKFENRTPSTTKSRDLRAFLLCFLDKDTNKSKLPPQQLDNCACSSPAPYQEGTSWKSFPGIAQNPGTQPHSDSLVFLARFVNVSLSSISGPGTAEARLSQLNHGWTFFSNNSIPDHARKKRRALLLLMQVGCKTTCEYYSCVGRARRKTTRNIVELAAWLVEGESMRIRLQRLQGGEMLSLNTVDIHKLCASNYRNSEHVCCWDESHTAWHVAN